MRLPRNKYCSGWVGLPATNHTSLLCNARRQLLGLSPSHGHDEKVVMESAIHETILGGVLIPELSVWSSPTSLTDSSAALFHLHYCLGSTVLA